MLEKFGRYPLTFGPTPIEKLDRLSKHLGGRVEIYAKREDCNSGLAFGGNKLRKLEYIIPDAIVSNADTLVSIGGVQSNHTRMVAAVAAKIGMKCLLVQESWVPHEDAVYDRVGNILLSRIMGAEVRLDDEGFDVGIRRSWEQALDESSQGAAGPTRYRPGPQFTNMAGLGTSGSRRGYAPRRNSLGLPSTTLSFARSRARRMPACSLDLPRTVDRAISSVSMLLPPPPKPRTLPGILRSSSTLARKSSRMTWCCSRGTRLPVTAFRPRKPRRPSACVRGSRV